MAAIEELSSDLLLDIMSHLGKHEWVAMAKTCKFFSGGAQRFLYHRIKIPTRGAEGHPKSDTVYPLFMTLWMNPQLAGLVHELDLRYDDRRKWNLGTRFLVNQASLDEIRMQALDRLCISQELADKVKRSIRSGGNHATLALAASLCTKLRRIDLDLSLFEKAPQLLLAVLVPRTNFNTSKKGYIGLRELHTFKMWNNEGVQAATRYKNEATYWDLAAAVSCLPLLETLQLVLPADTKAKVDGKSQISLHMVKRLQLIDLGTSKEKIAQLVRAAPKLVRLEHFRAVDIDVIINQNDEDRSYIGLWPGLQQALAGKECQLKELIIALGYIRSPGEDLLLPHRDVNSNWRSELWHRMGNMDHLQEFVSLQNLEIPICALLGWHQRTDFGLAEALPPNLTHLTLRDDCCDWPSLTYKWMDSRNKHDASATTDSFLTYLLKPDGAPIFRLLKTACLRMKYDQLWSRLASWSYTLNKQESFNFQMSKSNNTEIQAHEDRSRIAPIEATSQLEDYMYRCHYYDNI